MFRAWIAVSAMWLVNLVLDLTLAPSVKDFIADLNAVTLSLVIAFQIKEIKKLRERSNGDQ